ncbi:bifunctional N-acetylglucosamine-1-phosphate uridyltransferase/glucosamine-1-phosphate acetyltransferase [Candidatus Hydrogenosomobacter endosymbioticus]|uniref:Bifunctional protein GlmU n=1 Tax=Candidatus Hydrogenosomobacter endosymbioticus TaxID=2558174 RepID=A0ABM7V815_9PROT|nr:NTP transferase domain-containing protein [Candidatus Hydrogenosomobacter endosymbioticus]BDB95902.1 bifunctional protein GlmU [Candidatus Hydrogenosomobacter endosymbioticus]
MLSNNKSAVFILAAGRSSRFNSSTSKIFHDLCGQPVVNYVLDVARFFAYDYNSIISVISKDSPEIADTVCVRQKDALGTGDAFRSALFRLLGQQGSLCTGPVTIDAEQRALANNASSSLFIEKKRTSSEMALVLYGDAPLITTESIQLLFEAKKKNPEAAIVILAMYPENPSGYGRIKEKNGKVTEIVECKNASSEEKLIPLCNSGILLIDINVAEKLCPLLKKNDLSGEYYLTDIVRLATDNSYSVISVEAPANELCGINTRAELSHAHDILQKRFREKALQRCATLYGKDTIFLSYDTVVERDVTIHSNVCIGPGVHIHEGAEILPFSYICNATIGEHCSIGPFALISGNTVLHNRSTAGSFVEIKRSSVGPRSKVKHLSYIGDSCIGSNVNIGAGVVTANYDGHSKHKTVIGNNAFIGCNSSLIAPIEVGETSIIGAGSVITKNVPSKSLSLSRPEQKVVPLKTSSKHLSRKK